jgi:CheY-like chemotaxis protein
MPQTSEQAIDRAPRMLIADDDPAIVRLLARRCVKMGFEVDTATNGLQALMKANRKPPDILVIDVNMPGTGGFSVCERLLDPSRRPLNVVVVTGGAGYRIDGALRKLRRVLHPKGFQFLEQSNGRAG